jgi:hypothetical protein
MKKVLTGSVLFLGCLLVLITPGFAAQQPQAPDPAKAAVVPPTLSEKAATAAPGQPGQGPSSINLVLSQFSTEKIGQQGSSHRINVRVRVKMETVGPSQAYSSPTMVHVRWGSQPGHYQNVLCQLPVPSLRSGNSNDGVCEALVPLGQTAYFRGCVDPSNQMAETNESDNCAETSYRAQ